MPTSEQIEAAAKAIHAASIQDGRYTFDWCNELQSYDRDYFRAQARAALAAAEALEEVEWEFAVLNRDNRQVTDPDLTEAECRHYAEPYLKRGWVVRRRRRGPGPWIALEGETP